MYAPRASARNAGTATALQAEAEHLRQEQARLDAERQAGEKARAEREFRRLAEGGLTDRQVRAVKYVTYLESVVGRGRWCSHDEGAASKGTDLDAGYAMGVADQAARDAVAMALVPMIEQARAETESASAEKAEILRRGHQ